MVVLDSPNMGRSRLDSFGGVGVGDVGLGDSARASREGVSGGSRHSLSKLTGDTVTSQVGIFLPLNVSLKLYLQLEVVQVQIKALEFLRRL